MPERNWKALTLLSIVVPISLLATFKLTGIIQEPLTISQTITADTVTWNMSRPSDFGNIEEIIGNSYSDSTFSSSLTIHLLSYWENDGMLDYNDGQWLRLTASANTSAGFIYSLNVRSSETDEFAILHFMEHFYNSTESKNLALEKMSDGSRSSGAVLETVGIGQPKECALKLKPLWEFFDTNNVSHWITFTLEVTYFNAAIYRQVSLPVTLGIITS